MPFAFRLLLVVAVALPCPRSTSPAQSRAPPARPGAKIAPKIGAVTDRTMRHSLRRWSPARA